MSAVSYFKKAKNFIANNTTFNNTYVSGIDALQFLYEHAATGAMHDSDERYPPPICHRGTREVIIIQIKDWYGFLTKPDKPIMWIHAPAGYGKTAIAGTISKWLEEVEGLDFSPLGATFYFWRTSSERNSPARFIITIAYQLAMSIPELAPHIDNAVKRNPMILRKALEVQLMKLIVEPFKALGELDDMPNRLVVVDGLDECINTDQECRVERRYAEDQEKAQIRILELIHTLQSHRLPLSFLILSRPEAWIKQHIQSRPFEDVVKVVDLYALGDHLEDTEKYIRAELSRIAARIRDVGGTPDQKDDEWPAKAVVDTFVTRTNGHILYASTVIRHIDNPYGDPRHLLKNLIDGDVYPDRDLAHSSPFSSLNELYMQIMRSCPESNRTQMIEVLEDIAASAGHFRRWINLQRALATLDPLARRVPGTGFRALRPLHAVLRISNPGADLLQFSPFIHSSFPEFLRDSRLSLEFAIDKQKGIRRILTGCLDFMSTISLECEMGGDLYLFALANWPRLFGELQTSKPPDPQYLGFMEKLLSIDLLACSIKAHATPYHLNELVHNFPPMYAYSSNHLNPIVPKQDRHLFESEALVQQAVAQVVSSLEGSLVHYLRQTPDCWPPELGAPVYWFLRAHKGQEPNTWTIDKHNQVVQALWKMRQAHPQLEIYYHEDKSIQEFFRTLDSFCPISGSCISQDVA